MLPYTAANTTTDEECKTVGDTIGGDLTKALLQTLVDGIGIVKVHTFGNTLNN